MTEEENTKKTTTKKESIYVADLALSEKQLNAAGDSKKRKK